jgi:hypothetical protein
MMFPVTLLGLILLSVASLPYTSADVKNDAAAVKAALNDQEPLKTSISTILPRIEAGLQQLSRDLPEKIFAGSRGINRCPLGDLDAYKAYLRQLKRSEKTLDKAVNVLKLGAAGANTAPVARSTDLLHKTTALKNSVNVVVKTLSRAMYENISKTCDSQLTQQLQTMVRAALATLSSLKTTIEYDLIDIDGLVVAFATMPEFLTDAVDGVRAMLSFIPDLVEMPADEMENTIDFSKLDSIINGLQVLTNLVEKSAVAPTHVTAKAAQIANGIDIANALIVV